MSTGTKNSTNSGTLARPTAAGGGPLAANVGSSRLQGGEQEDLILPRIHIFQGLPQESKQYGKGFSQGDLVNTLTGEKLDARKFTPIFGYKEWICWKEPRGAGIEYRSRNKSEVPAADLQWDGETPPRAQAYLNWVVVFEGQDTPVVMSFTKTGINAGKTINTLETMRGKKGPGFYSIEMREKSNDKGAWVSPQIRPAGDPPEELKNLAIALYETLSGVTVQVEQESGGEFDPEQA